MIQVSKATETITVAGMDWLADIYKREKPQPEEDQK